MTPAAHGHETTASKADDTRLRSRAASPRRQQGRRPTGRKEVPAPRGDPGPCPASPFLGPQVRSPRDPKAVLLTVGRSLVAWCRGWSASSPEGQAPRHPSWALTGQRAPWAGPWGPGRPHLEAYSAKRAQTPSTSPSAPRMAQPGDLNTPHFLFPKAYASHARGLERAGLEVGVGRQGEGLHPGSVAGEWGPYHRDGGDRSPREPGAGEVREQNRGPLGGAPLPGRGTSGCKSPTPMGSLVHSPRAPSRRWGGRHPLSGLLRGPCQPWVFALWPVGGVLPLGGAEGPCRGFRPGTPGEPCQPRRDTRYACAL